MRKVTGLKAMLLLLMLLSIVAFFLWRLEDLNSREIRPENFSFINKIEIYILGLVLGIGAYPIYPEVAATHLSLYWKNGSDEREINDDFFLKSKVVQSAIQRSVKTNQRTQLAWPASAYTLSFDKGRYWESRVALALNGGSLSIKNEFVEVAICPSSKHLGLLSL
jgi:hypothetical protein